MDTALLERWQCQCRAYLQVCFTHYAVQTFWKGKHQTCEVYSSVSMLPVPEMCDKIVGVILHPFLHPAVKQDLGNSSS